MKLNANFHTHTTWCDGCSTPREHVERAIGLGFSALGFSGHMDPDIRMDLPGYTREIRSLEQEYRDRIAILCGIELDILYDPACAAGMDYVIGSTHYADVRYERPLSVDSSPGDLELLCHTFYGGDYYALARDYFRLEAGVYDRLNCTFVGHFDLVSKFNRQMRVLDETSREYLAPALEAMEYLVREGVPFEINTGQSHRGRLYPSPVLLRHLRAFGGEILINSDAHFACDLDKGFGQALDAARAAGFDHINILEKKNGGTALKAIPLD